MPTVISQMRMGPGGLELRVWEAPDTFDLDPDPSWIEQPQDPAAAATAAMLAGVPRVPR